MSDTETPADNSSRESDALKQILGEESVKFGDFILASGKSSSIYVDARLTTMNPKGMALIGPLGLRLMGDRGWIPDSVGGLTMGADPISFAVSYAGTLSGTYIRAFSVRKQAKEHGTGNLIEGPFRKGDKTVIVEDVVTTGLSAIKAIEAVETAGGHILGVLALVDREQGGTEAIRERGYDVLALSNISELRKAAGQN